MSIISASTLTNTALQYTADTTGTLVFKTGATPTTALTLNSDQSATFAGAVVTSGDIAALGVNATTALIGPSNYKIYLRNIAGTNRIDSYNYPITATVPLTIDAGSVTFAIADVDKVVIDSSGKVGINIASPTRRFQVGGDVAIGTIGVSGSYAVTYNPDTAGNTVFWTKSDNYFAWGTGSNPYSGGTEVMRIGSGGGLGIGTSTITYGLLQVNGAISASGTGGFNSSTFVANSRNPIWRFGNADGYGFSYFQATAGIGNQDVIGFHFGTATAAASQLQIIAGNRTNVNSSFGVYSLDSVNVGGVLGVSSLSNPYNDGSWALALYNAATTNALGRGLGIRNATAFNNGQNEFIYCNDTASARFFVQSNGGVYNFSANNVNLSDERTKKNIQLADSYLDKMCAIPVKTFLYDDQTDTDLNLGVIAQDVELVAPEFVTETKWGTGEDAPVYKAVYEADLMYGILKALQELKAEFDEYKATHP